MSVSISGILLDPYGQPARFAEVKFITWQGANDVLTTSNSVFKTSEDGAYAFSVEFGTFTVQVRYNQSNGKFQTISQKTIVNSATVASTLGELLLFNEPLTPPEIAYVEQLVAEAEGYRDESLTYRNETKGFRDESEAFADNAEQSAIDAANSAASIVGVPLNGGVWAAGQTFDFYNQYMIYNGTPLAPLTSTTLPYGPVGATPDFAFVGPYPLNDHGKLSNLDAAGSHDAIYSRVFTSIDDCASYTGVEVGKSYLVVSVDGIQTFKATSGLTANGYNVIDTSTIPIQIQRVEVDKNPSTTSFGAGFGRTMIQRINGGVDDVYMLVQGDSTGDSTIEWPYLSAVRLSQLYPKYSVRFLFWNDLIKAYDPPIDISVGTGTQTIFVYNCSRSGGSIPINTGDRHDAVYAGQVFDLIVMNYGHNNQIGNGGISPSIRRNNLLYRNIEVISQVIQDQPQAEIALTLQNNDNDFPEFTIDQCEAVDRTARLLGCSTIDVRSVFLWKRDFKPPFNDWYNDGVHPNLVGSTVWADIFVDGLLNPSKQQLTTINPLADQVDNIYDPFIRYWDESTSKPFFIETGSPQGSPLVSKNGTIFQTFGSSLQLSTNTGTKSWIEFDAQDFLLSGKHESGINFGAWVYVPAATLDARAGQVQIALSNGALLGSEYIDTEVRDRWHLRTVHVPRHYVDAGLATSLKLIVNSSYTNGEVVYIDRVSVNDGLLPTQPKNVGRYSPNYYYGGDVGFLNGTIGTASIAYQVSVTTDGSPASVFYINYSGVEAGRQLSFKWVNAHGVTGVISARSQLGGIGKSLAAKNIEDVSAELSWVPTSQSGSIRVESPSGQGTFSIISMSITAE